MLFPFCLERKKMTQKDYWIWMSRIPNLGCKRMKRLIERFERPEQIWDLSKRELMQVASIGEEIANQIVKTEYRKNIDHYHAYMEKNKIGMITILDQDYPENLKNLYDPPIVLFYKGNRKLINQQGIAIIGCRECSDYGRKIADEFSYKLSKNGKVIISGMAKGIDAYAHKGCLNAKGKTIAVLGNGIDQIYPKENINLYNEILEKQGLIISEYIMGTKPNKMNFPARNRIISGLANEILVIEAKKKSGTLITVDFGLEQGKEIFVIPGNISSPNSEGTNELIKQGAYIVTCVEDIFYNNH